MDDLLPSYESVMERDPWKHIARYLPSEGLCSAALVCHKWHKIFAPHLWGSPASHFGVQNDTVYTALTRFKRILPYVRSDVRELTHTLHFPPAHAEIYGGPHAEWLRDCFEYLPRLQCLIVDGLPFFDHASLLNLRHSSPRWQSMRPNTMPVFSLRLLDAAGCTNATSTGLAEALPHFPDLVSLDLSRTPAAKDELVLSKLKFLRNLRVLRLQGLGLRDEEFLVISHSVGTRVRSLDLSNNSLTDVSARLLLDHCMKETIVRPHISRGPIAPVNVDNFHSDNDEFESEDLVSHFRKTLTNGFIGSLAIEEAGDIGVTHLYLTKNAITVEGVSGLLRSGRLLVLDIGELPTVLSSTPENPLVEKQSDLSLPGVSKLTPILSEHAKKLGYLRINYQIVTKDVSTEPFQVPRAELKWRKLSPKIEIFSESSLDVDDNAAKAPEPVLTGSLLTSIRPILCSGSKGKLFTTQQCLDARGRLSPTAVVLGSDLEVATTNTHVETRSRHDSTHHTEDRRARLDFRQSQESRLHPGMLPQVHTLVLTGVPTATANAEVVGRIIQFIKDAAEEASIARHRAARTYILPPGRRRAVAESEYARSLFDLRRIVLEMAPPEATQKKVSSSWRAYPTKSSTEDKDSEAFWEAAAHDFSFFGDEECGLPSSEPGQTLPLVAMSGLEVAPAQPGASPKSKATYSEPTLDVIGEIGKFRKDRKAAYKNLLEMGQIDPEVEGWWPGDITVVRQPAVADQGELDCYGNRYQSGWYYR
ncbi:hypothetical protein T440DRAFT_383210 [Plenodomus tracheiphilus IPT5]|uniref:F-box domain-containing protein n=1 Tax=Plenodomus tracheiphilus IPT5 TaxID=1408161 RepID=A0A6A7BQA5_9PLEO|nr:hypothetical protein T440DRAFT_383210 [Plenodomus tracheiphilus IPT5]